MRINKMRAEESDDLQETYNKQSNTNTIPRSPTKM